MISGCIFWEIIYEIIFLLTRIPVKETMSKKLHGLCAKCFASSSKCREFFKIPHWQQQHSRVKAK